MAGVGSTPASRTSMPAEARPATVAAARNSPDARGSRPTTATGRWPLKAPTSASTCAAATERSSASSAVMSLFATPRTPSVPKSRATRVLPSRGGAAGAVADVLARQYRPAMHDEPAWGPGGRADPRARPRSVARSRAGRAKPCEPDSVPVHDDVGEPCEGRRDGTRPLIGHDPAHPAIVKGSVESRPGRVGHERQLLGEASRVPEGLLERGQVG